MNCGELSDGILETQRHEHLAAQFVKQRLSLFQIGGVEALREPAIDFAEHRLRFVAAALLRKEPREAGGRAQL
jgi:hypothetical protein